MVCPPWIRHGVGSIKYPCDYAVWPIHVANRAFSIVVQHRSKTSRTGKRAIQLTGSALEGQLMQEFTQTAKLEIEIGLGLKYRHDLEGGQGKAMRGWKGLALDEVGEAERVENGSRESDRSSGLRGNVATKAARE